MSDETTARVERLRSALEHGCERWEIDDLLRDAIAAIDSYVLRLDAFEKANAQLRVDVQMHVENTDRMHDRAIGYMRERDAALSRLSSCLEGHDALKTQTVRIREALTDEQRDGVDTEELARELSDKVDRAKTLLETCLGAAGSVADAIAWSRELEALFPSFSVVETSVTICGDDNREHNVRCSLPQGHDGGHSGDDEHHRTFGWVRVE